MSSADGQLANMVQAPSWTWMSAAADHYCSQLAQQLQCSVGPKSAAKLAAQVGRAGQLPAATGIEERDAVPLQPHQQQISDEHPAEVHASLRDPYRAAKMLAAGALAGAVSRTATAPVDRVKMLLQVQDGAALSIGGAFRQMAAEKTFAAYFKGNAANVLKIAPETACKFTVNDRIKQLVVSDGHAITPIERLGCGATAGAVGQFVIYPLEFLRTRMGVCAPGTYRSLPHAAAKIFREDGFLAFYRGMVPSMLGILPFAGVDIAVFELLKEQMILKYGHDIPSVGILGAGVTSSLIAQFVSYPLALVRTRMQAQGLEGLGNRKYNGMLDVFSQTFKHEGMRGLYKGVVPNMMKLAPAAGLSWLCFEETKRYLGVDTRT
ncbi:hypothetical protein WJX74_000079 [Apatococcus lobatus]|uniref:Uncharacterized protein n=1 Tax=Apatococcus lobatus TaxID=904363 RepID=A0AAW1QN70_9CHLO